MYVDDSTITTKSGRKYRRVILRTTYWDKEAKKIRHKSLLNLTGYPEEEIEAIKLAMKHKGNLSELISAKEVEIKQGKRIGGVWTAMEIGKRIGLDKALGRGKQGKLAFLQVMARLLEQGSRLSTVRLAERHGLCEVLRIERLDESLLYDNLEWLAKNQEKIEQKLYSNRYGKEPPQLFLYDVTSSYLEGEHNELAAYGYNRDKKKGKKQIVIGLLTDAKGLPIAVRVFRGNTIDTQTVSEQIRTLSQNFGVKHVTIVGDRGMIKGPQIEDLPDDFWYITAISKPQIRSMVQKDVIQYELFDSTVTEVEKDGVRYVLRRNPIRQAQIRENRASKFEALQEFVNKRNDYLKEHLRARPETALKNTNKRIEKLKLEKWVEARIEGRNIILTKNEGALEEIQKLDGCYVIKSNIPKDKADAQTVHDRYTDLEQIERDFRTIKQTHLELRPVFVRKETSTKGHVFVVMLALLLQRQLEKYWEDLDITVTEGLMELSSVSIHTITLKNVSVNKIPQPTQLGQELLKAADITLPPVLPAFQAKVATKKKLKRKR